MGKIIELREYGKSLPSNFLIVLLWKFAGADVPLLKTCPTDQSKYTALGGAMALCSIVVGCCLEYFVYSLTGDNAIAILMSILAALLFFFIYRMTISNMYSDGRSTISSQEIKSAIPSIILSISVGVFMATTMEMAIFRGQIESELERECKEYVEGVIAEEKVVMETTEEELQREIDEMIVRITTEEQMEIPKMSKPQKKQILLSMTAEQESLSAQLKALKHKNAYQLEKLKQDEIEKYMNNIDYAKSVEAMFNVSNWTVNPTLAFVRMFISLIFIVVLLSPVISKMMMVDGAYERLVSKMTDEITMQIDSENNTDNQLK